MSSMKNLGDPLVQGLSPTSRQARLESMAAYVLTVPEYNNEEVLTALANHFNDGIAQLARQHPQLPACVKDALSTMASLSDWNARL